LIKEEFEAFASIIVEVGMASLLDGQYCGIDGVMHFRIKDKYNEERFNKFSKMLLSIFLRLLLVVGHPFILFGGCGESGGSN
jgi:hypothetical protein